MTFTFTLTKRAHWRAIQDATRRTLAYKVAWAFFAGVPVLTLILVVITSHDLRDAVLSNLVVLLGGPLLMLVGFPLIHLWTVWSMHKNNAALRSAQTFEFTPTELVMRSPLHNAEIKWEAIHRVVETRHSILFYVSKGMAHFLPKEVVAPSDLPLLRHNLAQWLPGRVALRTDAAVKAAA